MAIKVNGTTVINDSRELNSVAGLDQTSKNNIPGFKLYGEASGGSTTGYYMPLNPAADLHYVVAELTEETESSNNMRLSLQNSSGTTLNTAYRLIANGTTSSFTSTNTTSLALNYWDMSSLNSTLYTGDRLLTSFYVSSPQNTTSPFETPTVYGTSVWTDLSGNTCLAHFGGKVVSTGSSVGRVSFFAQTGNLASYRIKVYSVGI